MEVSEGFVPFPLSQQSKGPQSKAAGKNQGGLPSDLTEVREHTLHQCFTMARSVLFCSPKISAGIRDLQLSGAFLALIKPRVSAGTTRCHREHQWGDHQWHILISDPSRNPFRNTERDSRLPLSCVAGNLAKVNSSPAVFTNRSLTPH